MGHDYTRMGLFLNRKRKLKKNKNLTHQTPNYLNPFSMKSLVAWWRRWLLKEKRSIEKFHFPCCKVRRINCTRGRGETLLSICNKAGGLIWIFPLGLLEWSQKCVGLANCNSALVLWPQDSNSFSNSRIRVWMTWNVQQNVVCYCAGFPICHRILNRFLISIEY